MNSSSYDVSDEHERAARNVDAEHIRRRVLERFDAALSEGWIRPYYQPIVRAVTNDICGEEALARWADPELGLLLPEQFLPVIEEMRISYRLDLRMVDLVLDDLSAMQALGVPAVPTSVNFAASDLDRIDIASELVHRLDARGISREYVVVEISESAAYANLENFRRQLRSLHEAGIKVWMDGFGRELTSLSALCEFDVDLVKLDMSLVQQLDGSRGDRMRVIVSSILRGISKMGLDTLAEGVETYEQARFLQEEGCDMLQGYLPSRPYPIEDVVDKTKDTRELHEEAAYWDRVGRTKLDELCEVTTDGAVGITSVAERPMGVIELRGNEWRVLRANDTYRAFIRRMGFLSDDSELLHASRLNAELFDPEFTEATRRSIASKGWEQVAGSLERGTGYLFYVRHIASSSNADAFAVSTIPALLGFALGDLGDVPVAYAVFRAVLDDACERVEDIVYAYANPLYLEWFDAREEEVVGRSFLEIVKNASDVWLPYCYRAVVLGETIRDVIYSDEIGHWVSFNLAPCPMEGYCVFAFSLADTVQREREELAVNLDTSDLIIDIADTFSGEQSYEVAMNRLLAALSRIAHARRVSLIERGDARSGVAFEWCDTGVEPLIGLMQGMKDEEFAEWDRLTARKPLMIVPDVNDSEVVDKGVLDQLKARGVVCMMVVPVKNEGALLGYIVIDNYELDEDLDVVRLLESVASFVATRMVNHRLVGELRRASLQDTLTGLLNRRGIDQEVSRLMTRKPGEPYVLALMDIDDFKAVNDVYGHAVGDEALRTLAKAIVESFPRDAVVGRNGGDEFLVFLYGCGRDRAERMIRTLLSRDLSCELGGKRYDLSMSVGFVAYPDQADDLKSAYSNADKALYAVKLAGKSGCMPYVPEMERQYRLQLGFTPREIVANVPGAIVVFRYSGDWEILFANDEALGLFGCDNLTELLRITHSSYASVVHPDDMRRVLAELDAQLGQGEVGKKAHVTYRVVTKQREARRVLGCGHLADVKGMGKVIYELLVDVG